MKTIKHYYIAIALLIVTLFIASCGTNGKNEKHPATDSSHSAVKAAYENNKIQAFKVVKPLQRSFIAEVLISGTARPNQQVTLYAMESGYVQSITKDIGDIVRKGEVIVELANPEVVREYEEKKAQLHAKSTIYERLRSTYEKTPALTPLQMVENAEAEYLAVKARVDAVRDRLNFLKVKAPFTGTITKRMVDHGTLVQGGLTQANPQGIVELQDTNPIRLTVPLPESDVAAVHKGMEVTVTFPELPGESFKAKLSRTAGALDPASKTMQAEIDINNAKGAIKPGMYAKVLMHVSSREGALSLPVTAQVVHQNQFFILVVRDNKVERIPLRKRLAMKDYFEILNPEITEESFVIVQGKGLVQPGQIVKPVLKTE
jgi:membrane fusion protein (multidrug efflux system)